MELLRGYKIDENSLSFGGETNIHRFHLNQERNGLITFANRYFLELRFDDSVVRIVDLDTLSKALRIVKSSYDPKNNLLYFIGSNDNKPFNRCYGIFNVASSEIMDMEEINPEDGFFATPPIFGDGIYGALSTQNVLYYKTTKQMNEKPKDEWC